MATLSFTGVTRQRFTEIATRAEAKTGQAMQADSGDVSFKGCRGAYAYHEAQQQLDINLLTAPLGLMGLAKKLIRELVQG